MVVLEQPSPARAQPAKHEEQSEAVAKFEEAQALYRAGKFVEAVALLRELMKTYPEPVLLYNLARAHEGAGQLEEAIAAYEQYLTEEPKAQDRGAIEQRVRTLRSQLAEHERVEEERKRPPKKDKPPPAPDPKSPALIALPWIITGVGVAGLGVGVTLGVLARDKQSDAEDAAEQIEAADALARAEDFALGANVAFVAGGVLTAAGAIWLIVEAASGNEVAFQLTPRSLSARIRF